MSHANVWELISQHYREQAPVDLILKLMSDLLVVDWRTYDNQQNFLQKVFLDPKSQKFPPSPKYSLQVLKKYTEEIEKSNVEDIEDQLYEIISELHSDSTNQWGHVSYTFKVKSNNNNEAAAAATPTATAGLVNDIDNYILYEYKTIGLQMNPHHNEVGLRMWESGYLLTEYILKYPSLISKNNILELGAGLGLTGLVASICCNASKTILTDCAQDVLDNLRDTCSLNDIECYSHEGNNNDKQNLTNIVKVEYLDWLNGGEEALKSLKCHIDVILAADVLYDPFVVPHFMNILQSLLLDIPKEKKDDMSKHYPIAFISATLRNPATLELFFNEIKSRQIPCYEYDFKCLEFENQEIDENDNDNNSLKSSKSGSWLNEFIFNYNPDRVRLFAIGWFQIDDIFSTEELKCWSPLSDDPMARYNDTGE